VTCTLYNLVHSVSVYRTCFGKNVMNIFNAVYIHQRLVNE